MRLHVEHPRHPNLSHSRFNPVQTGQWHCSKLQPIKIAPCSNAGIPLVASAPLYRKRKWPAEAAERIRGGRKRRMALGNGANGRWRKSGLDSADYVSSSGWFRARSRAIPSGLANSNRWRFSRSRFSFASARLFLLMENVASNEAAPRLENARRPDSTRTGFSWRDTWLDTHARGKVVREWNVVRHERTLVSSLATARIMSLSGLSRCTFAEHTAWERKKCRTEGFSFQMKTYEI